MLKVTCCRYIYSSKVIIKFKLCATATLSAWDCVGCMIFIHNNALFMFCPGFDSLPFRGKFDEKCLQSFYIFHSR